MSRWHRLLPPFGALACAGSIALGAYASHAADGDAQRRLALAALLAFGHGLALLVLAPRAGRRLAGLALYCMAGGLCLFCGSLVGAALLGTPAALAPAGGLLLIASWTMLAADGLR